MKIFKNNMLLMLGTVVAFMLLSFNASAAQDILGTGQAWVDQMQGVIAIGKNVFIVIGFFLFGAGVLYFYKDNKQPGQGHLKTGIVALLVGTGLMILSWLIGMFTQTVADGEGGNAVEATSGESYSY